MGECSVLGVWDRRALRCPVTEEEETGGEVDKEDGYSTLSLPMDCGTRNMDRASLSTDSSDAPDGGWGLWGLGGGE